MLARPLLSKDLSVKLVVLACSEAEIIWLIDTHGSVDATLRSTIDIQKHLQLKKLPPIFCLSHTPVLCLNG